MQKIYLRFFETACSYRKMQWFEFIYYFKKYRFLNKRLNCGFFAIL